MSVSDLLLEHLRSQPDKVLMRVRGDAGWVDRTAAEVVREVAGVAKGLMAAGIGRGDRVAILCRTRYEWTILDFAIWHAGAVPVPVYETSSASQVEWILSDSGARAVIVETADNATLVEDVRRRIPEIESVWQIDTGALSDLTTRGKGVSDADLEARHAAVGMSDLATIIYTSGTTGRPKGAELTHGNFVGLSLNVIAKLGVIVLAPGASTLLFMPLAHVFARLIEVVAIASGATLGHAPDVKNLLDDLGTFQPTFILSVPRVFEKVYNSAEQKATAAGKLRIFHYAASVSIAYSRALDTGGPGLSLRLQHKVADVLVLQKLRAVLGGRVDYAISGGAPLGERLGHFYRGLGLTVLEGYGLTETTAPLSVSLPDRMKIGTVGPPLPGTTIRIADDGEVLASGIQIFRGYRNNPRATAAAFTGEWFHTGDIGQLDDEGYLRITGRKKEIIVTAAGKNVAPAMLEDRVRSHPLISQCVVVGEARPFIGAIITLDPEMLLVWLSSHHKPPMSIMAATTDPDVVASIDRAVERANKVVSRAESIRKVAVLDDDFTVANGYLTPSLKVKRNLVLRDYATTIEELYGG